MKWNIHGLIYVFLAVLLGACAGQSLYMPWGQSRGGIMAGATSSAAQIRNAASPSGPPSKIVVFPFTTGAAAITLNQGLGARLKRDYEGKNLSAEQGKLAQTTAQDLCVKVASSMAQNGWNAACQPRGIPLPESNTLVIDGSFTQISEGNRLQRNVIGLGMGASKLDTQVGFYQNSNGNSAQLLSFSTHADSGKMPGAGVTGPIGLAAGAGAAASVGVNVAAAGVKSIRSSTAYLSDQTAKQIVLQANSFFSQQGWGRTALNQGKG